MIAVIENFFSVDQCEEIIDWCKNQKMGEASLYGPNLYDPKIRRGKTFLINERNISKYQQIDTMTQNLVDQIEDFNFSYKRFTLVEFMFQFAEYHSENKDFFDWHKDDPRKQNPRRLVSSSVQLSDYESYKGGDLEIKDDNIDKYGDSKKQGSLIIFDSQVYHRVTPVTQGTRYSLVTWARGPAPK